MINKFIKNLCIFFTEERDLKLFLFAFIERILTDKQFLYIVLIIPSYCEMIVIVQLVAMKKLGHFRHSLIRQLVHGTVWNLE